MRVNRTEKIKKEKHGGIFRGRKKKRKKTINLDILSQSS